MSIEEDIKSTIKLGVNQKAIINLFYTSNWHKQQWLSLFKEYNLSIEQYNVLRILRGQKQTPASLATIQERMFNKMSNTTRLIDKLLKKDLVTRQRNASNRRMIQVLITSKGLELLAELDQKVDTHNKSVTKKLTQEELKTLNHLLDKLRS